MVITSWTLLFAGVVARRTGYGHDQLVNAPALVALFLQSTCSGASRPQLLQSPRYSQDGPSSGLQSSNKRRVSANRARILIPDTTLFVIGLTDVSDCGRFWQM